MRVLLVEDDTATAKSIELMLKSESYVCDSTDLGEDGLEIGKLYDYDIIILDLMLPDMDGYEVLRRLRASNVDTPVLILSGLSGLDVTKMLKADAELKDIPVIAVTAFAMKGDEKRIRDAGCDGFVPKPVSIPVLLDAISEFIG